MAANATVEMTTNELPQAQYNKIHQVAMLLAQEIPRTYVVVEEDSLIIHGPELRSTSGTTQLATLWDHTSS